MRTYIKRLTITLDPDPEDNEILTEEQVTALYDAAVERWYGQDAEPLEHRFRLTSATTVDLRESVWVNEDNLPDFTCEGCDATATCEEYEANGWGSDCEGVNLCPECYHGMLDDYCCLEATNEP